MKDIFGGKLTAGIFAMVGLFIGIIAAGIMAGPFGQLGSYFNDSAQFSSGSYEGTTFSKVYIGITGDTTPTAYQINLDTKRAGGAGFPLVGGSGGVDFTPTTAPGLTDLLYNEQGQSVGTSTVKGAATICVAAGACTLVQSKSTNTPYNIKWRNPPEAFGTLSFLNNIMVGILALMTVIGLILRTKTAYDAFSGGGMSQGLDSTVVTEIATLVLGLVGVYFAPPLLNLIGNTATVYISGQYDFNFVGAILKIVLSVIPTILMIGVMGLVVGPVTAISAAKGIAKRASGGIGRRFGRRRMAY